MRAKRGVSARARHKKVLKSVKGMEHYRRRSFRLAKQGRIKALMYSYRDRRNKKRDLRSLWINRINIAAHNSGTSYAKLIAGMKANNVELDRKVMAELAVNEPAAFTAVLKTAKTID